MEDGIRRRNIDLRMPFCKDIYLRRQQTIQLFNIHTLRQVIGPEEGGIGMTYLTLAAGEEDAQAAHVCPGGIEIENVGGPVLLPVIIVPGEAGQGQGGEVVHQGLRVRAVQQLPVPPDGVEGIARRVAAEEDIGPGALVIGQGHIAEGG